MGHEPSELRSVLTCSYGLNHRGTYGFLAPSSPD